MEVLNEQRVFSLEKKIREKRLTGVRAVSYEHANRHKHEIGKRIWLFKPKSLRIKAGNE